MKFTPVYLCILDGFALGQQNEGNAIFDAIKQGKAPFIKDLFEKHPYSHLECSGLAVGLPEGTMGNSEVNHLNMGAGRIVYQSIERVNVAIQDGSFFTNEALTEAVKNCLTNSSTLHLMGILQGHGGTVHGSIAHLFALLELAKRSGLAAKATKDKPAVVIHLFTDGRDTNPTSAGEIYLPMLEAEIAKLGLEGAVKIGTIMGREVAMDRDTAYEKILIAMKALINGQGVAKAANAKEALANAYAAKQTDEFISPVVIGNYQGMAPKDSIVFFNFRQDRAIELTAAFRETDHKFFNYKKGTAPISEALYQEIENTREKVKNAIFVAMTEFYPGLNALTAFPEKEIPETVGEMVSRAGLKQLRLAGPEKFAHVTGWFSGRRLEPFTGEDRHLAQDLELKKRTENGKHYDFVPEMTAYLETDFALKATETGQYHLVVHNFQNGDMVGHTGNCEAATAAIGHLSTCLSKIVPAWTAKGGIFIITADHGNADEMKLKKAGKDVPSTQHSLNPVPFWVLGKDVKLVKQGKIPDIGVTIMDLIGLEKSKLMTAQSLLE